MTGLVGLGRFSLRLTKRQPKPTVCCTLLMTCCGLLMACLSTAGEEVMSRTARCWVLRLVAVKELLALVEVLDLCSELLKPFLTLRRSCWACAHNVPCEQETMMI